MGRVEGGELLLRVHEFMLDKLRERMRFTVDTPRRRRQLLKNRHRFDHVVAGGAMIINKVWQIAHAGSRTYLFLS